MTQFPGLCTLHRAEVLRLRGQLEEAEHEAIRACDDLLVSMTWAAGDAFNELGEVRLRRGELAGARAAFRRALELGMEAEPGLSRLRVEEGDVEGALKGLERVLADRRLFVVERRFLLLSARLEAALAGGHRDLARATLEQLEEEPELWSSPAHRAELEAGRGRVALAEGRPGEAIARLREARRGWLAVGAGYEAARTQTVLAQALEADIDPSGARLEWEAARDAFERLGAVLDARRAAQRLARLASRDGERAAADRSLRTFLFTDIVGSARLVDLLGDADWETLRRWHHRTLQSAFLEHGGEVVGPHEGDGFFVAFADGDAALDCAMAIQRELAAHREQHGFAPQVRIGAHRAESLRRGGDYAGEGVHTAASTRTRPPSRARQLAEEGGVADRVRFEVASAKDYPGGDYDLVAFFDCLHDMGDPGGAARHVRETLAPEGTWMLVEPFAHDDVADNLNPVGRLFYGFSTMVCTPASRAQEVGACLGAQAGERRLRAVLEGAGFRRVRRAAETPFNLVLEARV